jgi:hypothetical protein
MVPVPEEVPVMDSTPLLMLVFPTNVGFVVMEELLDANCDADIVLHDVGQPKGASGGVVDVVVVHVVVSVR